MGPIKLTDTPKNKRIVENLQKPAKTRKVQKEIEESPGELAKMKRELTEMKNQIKTLQAQACESRDYMLESEGKEHMQKNALWVDIDGVVDVYGEPDTEMIEKLKKIKEAGFIIKLFGKEEEEIIQIAEEHGIPYDNEELEGR